MESRESVMWKEAICAATRDDAVIAAMETAEVHETGCILHGTGPLMVGAVELSIMGSTWDIAVDAVAYAAHAGCTVAMTLRLMSEYSETQSFNQINYSSDVVIEMYQWLRQNVAQFIAQTLTSFLAPEIKDENF